MQPSEQLNVTTAERERPPLNELSATPAGIPTESYRFDELTEYKSPPSAYTAISWQGAFCEATARIRLAAFRGEATHG